ncbi:MAG: lamin tail domain-containing protein, partial [Planctomycetales bacterium]|nr:lamin tail domain-containing protein [Planctomycetales bacterium]
MARMNRQRRKLTKLGQRISGTEKRSTLAAISRRAQVETLEPRQLLAGDPVISEFQAINATGLRDNDGEYSDWIEIRNPGTTAQDLGGWYLTDTKSNLKLWKFPAGTNINAGGQIVVFASGKDTVYDVGGKSELHTNFKLAGDGEFLALVKPDGIATTSKFDPYPAQVEDQSYGVATQRKTIDLIADSAAVKALVPRNSSLGESWTQATFDDSAWLSGTQGVGYETLLPGYTVSEPFDALDTDTWTVDIPNGGTGTVAIDAGDLVIDVPSGQRATGDDRGIAPIVYRAMPDPQPADFELITQVTIGGSNRGVAGLVVYDNATGLPAITMEYASRSRFQLTANGQRIGSQTLSAQNSYYLRLTRNSETRTWTGYFKIAETDEWTMVAEAVDGGDNVPFIQDARVGVYGATPTSTMNARFSNFDLIVNDQKPVYGPLIGLDVGTQLKNINGSAYVRIPFTLDQAPSTIDELTMTAQYDDGFRAFINGVEVNA